MTPDEEQAYAAGSQRAWLSILNRCLMALGDGVPGVDRARWVAERAEAQLALRRLCKDHGDNDWPDNLHLADVIDKHLGRHLEQ